MNLNNTLMILSCMTPLLIVGCSSQQVFEGIKARNQNECYRLPESQQQDCLEAADVSFEEYQRQRKEAKDNQ